MENSGNVSKQAQTGVSDARVAESDATVTYFNSEQEPVTRPVLSWYTDHERPIIDHTIFGLNSQTYYVNYAYDEDGRFIRNFRWTYSFTVPMTKEGLRWWRKAQRKAKPGWRKPQRMAYPSERHKNRRGHR